MKKKQSIGNEADPLASFMQHTGMLLPNFNPRNPTDFLQAIMSS